MDTPLIKTKLSIPPARPSLVQRPRLLERLQEGLRYSLVIISAPAGFGKTTLISNWARDVNQQVNTAWISLDKGDDDPNPFWEYLVASVKTLRPASGDSAVAYLHSSRTPQVETLLSIIINELAGIPDECVIVLDDYQLINSKVIHDGITYLLEHLPSQIHVVIATRAEPPLPLARFRGKGMMLEISADDLRFNRDEAAALFKEMKTPGLSGEDIRILESHTEGWVIGLKMAALAAQLQPDIPEFIREFTGNHRYIMDYLLEEVLQRQSDKVQEFLLKTSVLEHLNASLCNAVTGNEYSQDILLGLEKANVFIIPLDESHQWYRYEHLFSELLSHQAEKVLGAVVIELHKRAGRWYETNGFPDDAVHHAILAGDWEVAARIIDSISNKRLRSGEFLTVLNWYQLMPEDIMQTYPRLRRWYIIALTTTGQPDPAELQLTRLEKATQLDDGIPGDFETLQTLIAISRKDVPRAIELGKKALSQLPPDRLDDRSTVAEILGNIYFSSGNFEEAEPLLHEAYVTARQAGNNIVAVPALSKLGYMKKWGGKLHESFGLYQQALELAGESPAGYVSHQCLGDLYYEWNDLKAAVYHVQQAIEQIKIGGTTFLLVQLHEMLASCLLAQGDKAGAGEVFEKACRIAHNNSSGSIRAEHAARHIFLALRQDDLATASQWGNTLAGDIDFLAYDLRHAGISLLLAQGQKTAAAEALHSIYADSIKDKIQPNSVLGRLYQALSADTQESALEFLSGALTMAEPEGYIRTFIDRGKLLVTLLRKALSRGITPEYTGKLLNIIEAEEGRKRALKSGENLLSPHQAILSGRELEVLKLMAEELSNQQIAEKLFISTGTVKIHAHNILEKLGVKARTQAVARAREINLI